VNVLYPVKNLDEALAFYRDGLGLAVKFTDGDRYASLEDGFALAGPEEDVTGGVPAATFKVTDVAATVERLTAAGAQLIKPAEEGPHEVRAVLRDPAGNPFIVYAPVR
jgi:predicted enzyme related to lactoylglutathione lyase